MYTDSKDTTDSGVPSPVQPIVVFDGACNLCSGAVEFILKNDKSKKTLFAPLQSEIGRKLLADHGLDPGAAETILVIRGKSVLVRSEAALEVARHLGFWSWLRIFRVVPRPWRDCLYSFLARNRYRWFGKRHACFAPTKEQRERFLEMETP